MTLAAAVDDLHRQVDALLNPWREKVTRLDGTTTHVNVPSLWRQLHAALGTSRTLTGGGGGAGARLPLDPGVLDVVVHVTFEVTSRTRQASLPLRRRSPEALGLDRGPHQLSGRHPVAADAEPGSIGDPVTDPMVAGQDAERAARRAAADTDRRTSARPRVDVPANLRQLAQHAVATRDTDIVDRLATDVRSWVRAAHSALTADEQGNNTQLLRGFPCPACRATHHTVVRDGEPLRAVGAVVVAFRDFELQYATCRVCSTTWAETWELQRLYAAATTERNRMDQPVHHIAFTVEQGAILAVASCTAPLRADCRLTCEHGCATIPCGHPLVDAGDCGPTRWLNEYGPTQAFTGDAQPPVNGPIDIEWDGQFYGWTYLHPIVTATAGDPSVEMAASA